LKPWTRFLEPKQAQDILIIVASRVDKLQETPERAKTTISELIAGSKDVNLALQHLGSFTPLGTTRAYIELLQSSDDATPTEINVSDTSLKQLITLGQEGDSEDAYKLVAAIIDVSPNAIRAFGNTIRDNLALLQVPGLLGVLSLVMDLPGALPDTASLSVIAETAVGVLRRKSVAHGHTGSARGVIRILSRLDPLALSQAVGKVTYEEFNPNLASAAVAVSKVRTRDVAPVLKYLVEIGLQWAVRALSSDGVLHESTFDSLARLRELVFVLVWRMLEILS
jgi:hypothetical protein